MIRSEYDVVVNMSSSPPAESHQFHPLKRRGQKMFQVTFSDQAMGELNKLPVEEQMEMVDVVSNITSEELANPTERLGRFKRGSRTYYRIRAGDFRCYFERRGDTLYAHYILHRNTVTDFVFRMKMPYKEEQMVEQQSSFWKYLETLGRN